MRRAVIPALLLTSLLSPVFGQVHPDVIYGDDDRLDLHQVQNEKLRKMAESTVALFQGSDVNIDAQTQVARLTTESYGGTYNLCPDEPFRDQNSGAFCSGSLVASDMIMTAGHCVKSDSACKNTKFVFGFGISQSGAGTPGSVPAGEVYGCAALIGREQIGTGQDWALIRLDRQVANHAPLKISRRGGNPPKGTPLVVIGHPAGLPTKVAGGASVRDDGKTGYFVANLDTYGGNSGSAVFNAVTGEIEGILVRGETDYVWDSAGKCRRSNKLPPDGGRGEDVTAVGIPGQQIPKDGVAANLEKPGPVMTSLQKGTASFD
jgi:V8-like Glu-specific endopeptidase